MLQAKPVLTETFDAFAYRRAMGNFATGVAVATCRLPDGQPFGVTINSMTSVSLEPPLMLFCLGQQTRAHAAFAAAPLFAINLLAAAQEEQARRFAAHDAPGWDTIAQLKDDRATPPLLAGCIGWLNCRRYAVHAGGDHSIIVGQVTAVAHDDAPAPLLYFRSRYRRLGED